MYQLGISKSNRNNKIPAFTQAEDLNSHGGGPIIYNTAIADAYMTTLAIRHTNFQQRL